MDTSPLAHEDVDSQDVAADSKPWTSKHELFITLQNEQRPDENGWATVRLTGMVNAVCNCGLSTGWITREEYDSQDLHATHARPVRNNTPVVGP